MSSPLGEQQRLPHCSAAVNNTGNVHQDTSRVVPVSRGNVCVRRRREAGDLTCHPHKPPACPALTTPAGQDCYRRVQVTRQVSPGRPGHQQLLLETENNFLIRVGSSRAWFWPPAVGFSCPWRWFTGSSDAPVRQLTLVAHHLVEIIEHKQMITLCKWSPTRC